MAALRKTTQVRQKQIISAARKLISRYGSEHLTVRRLAKEIGVSEGAIYRHFKSKKEILFFLLDDVENDLIFGGSQKPPLKEESPSALENMLLNQLLAITKKEGMSFQIIAEIESLGDKKLNQKARDVIYKYIDKIKLALTDDIKAGLVKPDIDLDAISVLIFGMVQGLVTLWTLSHYSIDLKPNYQTLMRMLHNFIAVAPEKYPL